MHLLVAQIHEWPDQRSRALHESALEYPAGYRAPAGQQFTVETPIVRLQFFDQPPEIGGVVHVFGVRQLMDEEVAHDLRAQKHQGAVQAHGTARGAASPAGSLASNADSGYREF